MLHCLAKTKTRIEDNALPGDAVLQGTVEALSEEIVDFIQHVPVRRCLLHCLRCALHMHERDSGATPRNERGHLRIEAHRTDIVHQHCSCIQRGCRDAGAVRIDGHQRPVALHDLPTHRYRTLLLDLGGDRYGAGAGRLSAYVDDIGTGGQHGFGMLERLLWLQVQSTVREGIGCHVQDAHNVRTLLEVAYPITEDELGQEMVKRVATFRELLARTPVDELEVREHPRVIFRVGENTLLEAIVRYLVAPREAGRVKTRLIKKLLAALNAAPEKVMFPAGAAR